MTTYKFKIDIGDWSNDGHGKADEEARMHLNMY
jgi:hypothetical protein